MSESISQNDLRDLEANLRGSVVTPDEEGYDEARRVWNGMIDKRPALIVRCAGVADVIHVVNLARTKGFLLAVRGGSHNVAGNAVCDGGIVIDLSRMKGIRVDPEACTARAEPGSTWRDFDRETQVFGLATTGGLISTTGIAGLTLGGGIGWLVRKHGLSCDNLVSADVVTADGRLVTANEQKNDDLFWGVRGGGGNFGIVTSFEYRLHHVPRVLGGNLIYPLDQAQGVLKFYRDFTAELPDELTSVPAFVTSPDGVPVMVLGVCYVGSIQKGEKLLKPLRKFGHPLADDIAVKAYTEHQQMLDAAFPPGRRNYWKSDFITGLSDDAIGLIVEHFAEVGSQYSALAIEHLGGAYGRVAVGDTAFPHRNAEFNLLIMAIWSSPEEDEKHIGWARELWDALQPFSTGGVYVNYLGEEGEDRVRAAYGREQYDRLLSLKKKYDPTNLFSLNQNVKPTG